LHRAPVAAAAQAVPGAPCRLWRTSPGPGLAICTAWVLAGTDGRHDPRPGWFPGRMPTNLFQRHGSPRRWNRVGVRGAPLFASQEENEWPREDHTNPFAQPERTGIVRVYQKSQDQPGAKVEPGRRTTAPDRRAHAVHCRRRHQPRRPPPANIRVRKLGLEPSEPAALGYRHHDQRR
jgi:hypothetical protein